MNEYREHVGKLWRRLVDDLRESGVNTACWAATCMLNDNIDLLWWVIWCFFMANVRCSMCKGDVSNAYKRLPPASMA